jgi:predicted nucleic acid-binding protein
MVLADTSVWVDHFRRGDKEMVALLNRGEVMVHPFVIGELACGRLNPRGEIIDHLSQLPRTVLASEEEALAFIEAHKLMGSGLGYVDVHLLASARLTDVRLWTKDSALRRVAQRLDLGFNPVA